mmetsp:Transcript_562/g.1220  ORF Transcript_562/g.1220 Transcript_562/m.1220 type:complete len:95 (+) Transcript_562:339-623(+)
MSHSRVYCLRMHPGGHLPPRALLQALPRHEKLMRVSVAAAAAVRQLPLEFCNKFYCLLHWNLLVTTCRMSASLSKEKRLCYSAGPSRRLDGQMY